MMCVLAHISKRSDTSSASITIDPLNQKLESNIVELGFQVVNCEREISHLKTTYKNLLNSIKSNREHAKLYELIYENAQLRTQGFKNTYESVKNISGTSVTPRVDKSKLRAVTPHSKKLHASTQSHSVPEPREFSVMKHKNLAPSSLYDRFQHSDGYHVVPPPYTGTVMPPKPDLVFTTAPTIVKTDHSAFTYQLSPTKPERDLSHTNRPTSPIIKD
nr:hypothetical protein [Tanacetum cinerariifolium]